MTSNKATFPCAPCWYNLNQTQPPNGSVSPANVDINKTTEDLVPCTAKQRPYSFKQLYSCFQNLQLQQVHLELEEKLRTSRKPVSHIGRTLIPLTLIYALGSVI